MEQGEQRAAFPVQDGPSIKRSGLIQNTQHQKKMCIQVDKKYAGCGHFSFHSVKWCLQPECRGPGAKHDVVEMDGKCSDCSHRERSGLKPPPWLKQ
jgi:hypothetical protein